ncbi:aspartyl/glutamyl-tRNA(Asn/Gln) amidotransferase subunit C [Stella humosa]|uniref:Aspartyl/glutamyl-tRNA(Asn/Gln) amidotransferase subunit C n=1 Tax=Stella humosa TaxID=94 RepID=A0A3N1KSB5_9PROT|nr:Asp-tRNA(Asn)/Glu-tRNA(Gln) amidotransferase subunit GatC [Stella humosa]ROP81178.1 aspartyl/glutamyl-tRNA(Asn/Gln) amidotransferase subunit C [Stella humosa]BBK32524.1 aspartyl/glutamyl-tRNA(Asn/Gln) amidotransferase subunit C [Stella humosa]
MAIDTDTVAHIARLARIKVTDDEKTALAGELSTILQWIEQLDSVDTAGVEPVSSVVDAVLPWRADRVTDGGQAEKILRNAPEAVPGFFAVPKVVE